MTREQEIKILQSLKGDTYFGALFGDAQIDAMCDNIAKDYPIEFGLDLFERSEIRRENVRLKERVEALKKTDVAVATELLTSVLYDEHDMIVEFAATRLIGRANCLRIKLHNNLKLTEQDREELIRLIDQNL